MSAKSYSEKVSRMQNRLALFKKKNGAYRDCYEVWQGRLFNEALEAWKNGEGRKWFFIAIAYWLRFPVTFK